GPRPAPPARERAAGADQPLLRHPDPPDAGDEGRHDARRGRRRAARRRPYRPRPLRPHGRADGQGSGDVPAVGHHVQRGGDPHPLPRRRRGAGARDQPHPAFGGRRPRRLHRRADPAAARRARHLHRRRRARRHPPAHPLRPAAAPAGSGADRQHRRRRRVAARTAQRGGGRRARAGLEHAHGRRPADERLRRRRHPAGRDGGRLRLRLARLHQGPRRAARRRAVRLARFHRPGLALEATPRRLHAPGRHLRRRLPLLARPPRGPLGRGPRQRPRPGAWPAADTGRRGGGAGHQSRLLRHARHGHRPDDIARKAGDARHSDQRP
ncbi:MAG: Low-specificity L-threonine aldolase, partial [uncultured Acetobacteraceae bacterium]